MFTRSVHSLRWLAPMLALACLASPLAFAQDVRFGASSSASGVASLDATWLFLDVPTDDAPVRLGARADVSARFSALGDPSAAATFVLDAAPENGVAAHLGAGVTLVRGADMAVSPLLLAGVEWPVADFLRLRLEGSLVPSVNAAGIGVGLVILPFGGTR